LAYLETFLGRVPAKIKKKCSQFLLFFLIKKKIKTFLEKQILLTNNKFLEKHPPRNFLENPNLFSE
jgi:hypothetical protein